MARKRRKALSAITGERLEYRLPGSVMDALGLKGAHAACFDSSDSFLRALLYTSAKQERKVRVAARGKEMYGPGAAAALPEHLRPAAEPEWLQASRARAGKRYERSGKLATAKAASLSDVIEKLRREEMKLRERGIKGAIPVCVGRSTGKKAGQQRYERRVTAIHERFHADVRRYEARKGIQPHKLERRLQQVLEQEFGVLGAQAIALAQIKKWSPRNTSTAEEVLARVEEIRKSCIRSKADCDAIKDEFHTREQRDSGKYRVGGELVRFDHTMERLTDAIVAKYSGAMGVVGAAHRALLAQDFRGFRRKVRA